jgi:hypothetical protein
MCMVELLQLNLEAKFSKREDLMPIILHLTLSYLIALLCYLLLLFGNAVSLLWTLVHLVLGVSLLVIFCFCCKGNIVPRVGREKGFDIL